MLRQPVRKAPLVRDLSWKKRGVQSGAALPYLLTEVSLKAAPAAASVTFAGDVGSISMAVFLAYFMVQLIFEKGQIGYLLFFSVYGIDAIVTILYRIKNKENILQAHRSHLYQYLANELRWSHVTVSVLYALFQFVINIVVLALVAAEQLSVFVFLVIGMALTGVYLGIRIKVLQLIKLNSSDKIYWSNLCKLWW